MMCHKVKTLAKNCYGQLSYCGACNTYHLDFNNIYLQFTPIEFKAFKKFVAEIDVAYWESCCRNVTLKRKIPIQTRQQNLAMVFNQQEFKGLNDLIFLNTTKPDSVIQVSEIDYMTFLN